MYVLYQHTGLSTVGVYLLVLDTLILLLVGAEHFL